MNKKQLLEDIKFPLSWDTDDYKIFIFDSEGSMIADVEYTNLDATKDYHPYEKLIGDFKEVTEDKKDTDRYFLYKGDYYDEILGIRIGSVRGWGRLQYKDKSEERQDNVAEYILNVMNS